MQVLSKFAIPYLLAKQNKFNGSIVNVCAPDADDQVDLDDIDLKKAASNGTYGRGIRDVSQAANRMSTVINCFTLEFPTRMNNVQAVAHVFPGIVAGGNAMRAWPAPLPMLGGWILQILSAVGILHNADSYAHIPVNYLKSKANGLFKNPKTPIEVKGWAKEEANRARVWNKLVHMIDG